MMDSDQLERSVEKMLAGIWGFLVEGLGHGLSSHVWWQFYAEDLLSLSNMLLNLISFETVGNFKMLLISINLGLTIFLYNFGKKCFLSHGL